MMYAIILANLLVFAPAPLCKGSFPRQLTRVTKGSH